MPENRTYYNSHNPRAGIGNASSFLVSGIPFMTGSATLRTQTQVKIKFPRIAREVVVTSKSDQDLRVYFTDKETGTSTFAGLHYITLTEERDSFTFRCKCKEDYIYNADASSEAAYEVYAELTNVTSSDMYILTGSGLTIGPHDTNQTELANLGGHGGYDQGDNS